MIMIFPNIDHLLNGPPPLWPLWNGLAFYDHPMDDAILFPYSNEANIILVVANKRYSEIEAQARLLEIQIVEQTEDRVVLVLSDQQFDALSRLVAVGIDDLLAWYFMTHDCPQCGRCCSTNSPDWSICVCGQAVHYTLDEDDTKNQITC